MTQSEGLRLLNSKICGVELYCINRILGGSELCSPQFQMRLRCWLVGRRGWWVRARVRIEKEIWRVRPTASVWAELFPSGADFIMLNLGIRTETEYRCGRSRIVGCEHGPLCYIYLEVQDGRCMGQDGRCMMHGAGVRPVPVVGYAIPQLIFHSWRLHAFGGEWCLRY